MLRGGVLLRALTYPSRAALSICSDLDKTPDRRVYWESLRFLNTTHGTAMGPGVGLEVGNSIYFDMPGDQFAYWNTDDAGREMVRTLIRSGHIDCLHSYGDLARRREDAERAIEEMVRHGCQLRVWVDHSKAPTNFGPDIMAGRGDVVGSETYHADLTLQYGIGYVWRGRTTGVNGQDVALRPGTFAHMLTLRHLLACATTMAKEAVKVCLGRRGHPRWEMYAANRVLRPSTLRSGQPIWEFMRCNPFWGGSGRGATSDEIGHVLTERMLERVIRVGGVCVLYTHLGKISNRQCPLSESAQVAFRRLAALHDSGRLLVRTTHRLLRYLTVRDGLRYRTRTRGDTLVIIIEAVADPVFGLRRPSSDDLQGITFMTKRRERIEIEDADGMSIQGDVVQNGDTTLVTIPWRALEFPAC